jgi:transposase-like protein
MGTQRYSPEFKQAVVEELLAGAKRPGQLCREHGIDISTLRKWREQYAQQGVAAWSAAAVKTAGAQEDKIAELERIVGQLTVENLVLKKALQRAHCLSASSTPSLRS